MLLYFTEGLRQDFLHNISSQVKNDPSAGEVKVHECLRGHLINMYIINLSVAVGG
jgi:hypothetical protein